MIEIKNLNKTYDRRRPNANHVLHDISFSLPDTGFICILGPSGCGKTSLLNIMGGLDDFDNGTILSDNVKATRYGTALFEAERNRSFGYIFQNYYLLPEHSVGYNVYLGLHSLDLSHADKIRRVKEALKAVDMDRYIRRDVGELSGGQQQRVAIARALARGPRVIFADEPTGNLDEANTLNICSLLRQISKTSLVIMVTHEQRIANFFADRIIYLDNGRIARDNASWEREALLSENTKSLYTGDYTDSTLTSEQVTLRILQEEGIAPVQISVFALKDRIVIKLNDERTVTCSRPEEIPVLVEGSRPVMTPESLENDSPANLNWEPGPNSLARAGRGIRFREMLREAVHISHDRRLRSFGMRFFLLVLTVLTSLCVADFITISSVNPRDFLQTHSQALEIQLARGANASASSVGLFSLISEFMTCVEEADTDILYMPNIPDDGKVSGHPILQTSAIYVTLSNLNYVPLTFCDEATLIMGRMPESGDEIVVDRWVLDAVLAQDGVAQNGITGIDYFLNKQVFYPKKSYAPTIVGICDSNEPAIYSPDELFIALGTRGTEVAGLSSLQARFPGKYDDIVLSDEQCIVLPHNAGSTFRDKLFAYYNTNSDNRYQIMYSIEETAFYARIVVADSQLQEILNSMISSKFWVYTRDKAAAIELFDRITEQMNNRIRVTVIDSYTDSMNAYQQAATVRADTRTIVTLTILALSMVMLYLLRRSQVQSRIGMLSVYRLLGIPTKKTVGVFVIESILSTLSIALPAVAGIWAVIAVLQWLPSIQLGLLFPWQAAVLVYLAIILFHLLVSILPLVRLLRLPPAQLAAKYDF